MAADDKIAVTAVGCLQSERDYRHDQHSSKFAGTGPGLDNEYILIDAVIGGPDMAIKPSSEQESTNCIAARGNGQAFELTGAGENGWAALVGRRVVVHGMLKHAQHDTGPVGTSGTFTPVPTNGGSILGSDLKLREINLEAASLAPVMAAAKNEPAIFGAPEPQPEPPPPAAEPQVQLQRRCPNQKSRRRHCRRRRARFRQSGWSACCVSDVVWDCGCSTGREPIRSVAHVRGSSTGA